jgi:formylglycine-generating enzyme required for sulfatase activity
MKCRTLLLAAPVVALGVAIGFADDKKKGDEKAKPKSLPSTILPVPENPTVPSKVDLPAKGFTESIEDEIREVDPEGDLEDPNFEQKFVKKVKSKATFEMVYVPGGKFKMGSPAAEAGRDENEGPQHEVTVRPFWLAKFETTWDLYDLWYKSSTLPRRDEADGKVKSVTKDEQKVEKPDAITRPTNPYVEDSYGHSRAGKPAICMSHHAAMVFCHWLRLKTKRPYRLPTEAEWEYACRAGFDGPYGFDDKKEKLTDYAWFKDNSPTAELPDGTTHKPGAKKANKFGLYDMHGNVGEWTLDLFDPKLYDARAKNPLKVLTFAKPTDQKWGHVVKGGSWKDEAADCRAARRLVSELDWMSEDPNRPRSVWWLTKMDNIGFRVALPVDEYPELVGLKPMVWKENQLK